MNASHFSKKRANWETSSTPVVGLASRRPGRSFDVDNTKGGKAPKLAEVYDLAAYDLGGGFLFVSQPAWVPRDQLEMPPFMVEHLLGRGAAEIVDMEGAGDDEALLRYAEAPWVWFRPL